MQDKSPSAQTRSDVTLQTAYTPGGGDRQVAQIEEQASILEDSLNGSFTRSLSIVIP
jgi:hypothetical protein